MPGTELRIKPPLLYVNGKIAEGRGFARVMAAKDGYRGYALGRDNLAIRSRPIPSRSGTTSRWATTVTTATTAASGVLCRRKIWSGAACWFTGRSVSHWGLIR